MAEFAVEHEEQFKKWNLGSNYLCCLEADIGEMRKLIDKLDFLKLKYTVFREPDIGNKATAIAVQPLSRQEHKKIFKHFKLALS